MTLKDLNKDQRKQLKARLLDDELMEVEGRTASYGEIANAVYTICDIPIVEYETLHGEIDDALN